MGQVPERGVCCHPSTARRDLQAVEVIVHILVGDVLAPLPDGVDLIVHGVEENHSISQTHHSDVATFRESLLQVVEGAQHIGLHVFWRGHVVHVVVDMAIADIVSDERVHQSDWQIRALVPRHGLLNVVVHGARACAVDSDVLIIAVDAAVAVAKSQVGRVDRPRDVVHEARVVGVEAGCG